MSPCLLVLLIMLSIMEIMTRVTTSPRDVTPMIKMDTISDPGGIFDALRLIAESTPLVAPVATNAVNKKKSAIMIMN